MIRDIKKEINHQKLMNSAIQQQQTDFAKIRLGLKTLDDAVYKLGDLKKANPRLADKATVLRAIQTCDYQLMREVSNYFFKISGIYSRLCRYMANLYRYDWVVTPYVNSTDVKKEKIDEGFHKALTYLDNFEIKKFCKEAALKVVKDGCYYGYVIEQNGRAVVQELPANYCRSQFLTNGICAVEFNMKFFDDYFKDANQKVKILKMFPKEFVKGYVAYKEGRLKPEFSGDTAGWYLLDPQFTIKFNLDGEDVPPFIAVIPAILDLDEALDLDKKKMQQQLLKIIIQQMPLDKNGELVFDTDEIAELHTNAVHMLGKAIGLDVLTTPADVQVASLTDNSSINTSKNSVENAKNAVFDQAGVSQMQFNTTSNLALEKSTLNDEAFMFGLVLQFQQFLNRLLKPFNKNKKLSFRAEFLPTTSNNYQQMAKLYAEQVQRGYSKMLPQIALGQSQSSVLATAYFENEILDLVNVLIPPITSATMNADILNRQKGGESSDAGGRPTNESQGKPVSDKTIKNKESAGKEA